MTAADEQLVVVGSVVGLFGVRGWVRVISHTQPRENLLKYRNWRLGRDGKWQPTTLEAGHPHGKGLVLKLKGYDDRDQARVLIGQDIAVPRSELPPLPEGEYYWVDLVGLRVETTDGHALGRVDHLLETGANDVLVVRGEDKGRLIPFVQEQFVKEIDLDAGLIRVDWDPEF
ncbi:MAG: ribosome maturation factor RimM [Xanthomonadaceae bacterium]|nr:ribosome maturation factor RimM [Xanthomonadaceae bacterium]